MGIANSYLWWRIFIVILVKKGHNISKRFSITCTNRFFEVKNRGVRGILECGDSAL
jgi:hypothetical protein